MKKIFINIFAAAAILTGCNSVLIEEKGEGYFNLEISASDEQYKEVTKSSDNEDVNEFSIVITRSSDNFQTTFDRFGDMPQMLPLSSGAYTLKATSPNVLPAAFDQPIYGVSHDFEVKVGAVTSEKLTCTLQNVKVTFNLSDTFKSELKNYTITVSNGDKVENALYWTNVSSEDEDSYTTKDITKAGYFEVAPITIRVDAIKATDDSEAYHEIKITDAKARDHFIVGLDAKVTGQAGFQISIDPSVNVRDDEEVFVPGFDEDPVEDEWDTPVEGGDDNTGGDNTGGDNTGGDDSGDDNQGGNVEENPITLTWEGYETLPEVTEIEKTMDINLNLHSPDGISDFKITIESETPTFLTLVSKMTSDARTTDSSDPVTIDLINDSVAVEKFKAIGLKTGTELTADGVTDIDFQLSKLVPMIPSAGRAGKDTNHTFTLSVEDKKGVSNEWALTFHVPAE